ncbi:phage baseplate protein [Shouchella lehensis]|uniref:LysM domain-containing protein n=1 Tax=Shouchella lehensis TaxID=300825 RepID=A0A4Y7WDS5_9BACI|nr:LysM domain-containing protein [Shouchella lehensis]MBG9783589.1 hypothetical protein [Shouchella lehensis]TES45653.1 LysM domain-containing protein [Shouchella lehensis]
MTMLGRVKLVIERESDGLDLDVTSFPVEKGSPLTDHVRKNPETMTISGFLLGPNAVSDYNWLVNQRGKQITYTGRKVFKNVLISNISRDVGEYQNGFSITVELKEVRIAKTPFVKKAVKNNGNKQKSNTKKDTKKYHVMKWGQTYSHLRMWYGTSLNQLRAWNKYPDRRIPTGAKLRVK